jgi:hypothetical protein
VTVFSCAKCGAALTGDLVALPALPEVGDLDEGRDRRTGRARSTVPRGCYAVDPEPWGAPYVAAPGSPSQRSSAGPRGTFVVHRDDLPGLVPFANGNNQLGCCGPAGADGPNLACACGSRMGTWVADCLGPNELRLDPVRVYAWHPEPA